MDLNEFKLQNLGIDKKTFGRIYSFVDFGNVNYWFEYDERDGDGNIMQVNEKLVVEINRLAEFINLFSAHSRFYFGLDDQRRSSIHIIAKARKSFSKVRTKPIQRIKHYLSKNDSSANTRSVNYDLDGQYIYIPKCNFDVEICVDAINLIDKYETFCIFSSDSDFSFLLHYLKQKGKKIILVKGGYALYSLVKHANLIISAQKIKKFITFKKIRKKQKSRR